MDQDETRPRQGPLQIRGDLMNLLKKAAWTVVGALLMMAVVGACLEPVI